MNTWLITGGAGFIGSNFILKLVEWFPQDKVINLDKLTYSSNLDNLHSLNKNRNHVFVKGDITDPKLVKKILQKHRPDKIVNFAAETHVDRSILDPQSFIKTNINGVLNLLENAKNYWSGLAGLKKEKFRFVQVSTDEVYGSLDKKSSGFTEETAYAPNSPYSASKAGADHLTRAFFHTYKLPVLITNCSNNYGPYQFPEKLIPLTILNALQSKKIPIYGKGNNIRDWLYVTDHCKAIVAILEKGRVGEKYNIGGQSEKTNIEVVREICAILDKIKPQKTRHENLISFVKDRPGHDFRYAINISKIRKETGWVPEVSFKQGMRKTVEWYVSNPDWLKKTSTKTYSAWVKKNYHSR